MVKEKTMAGDVYCPRHKKTFMKRMYIISSRDTKKTKTNIHGKVGSTTRTNWFYCVDCDKPYKVKMIVQKV